MSKEKGRYSKVYHRLWVDEKVKRLSQPQPSGVTLFLRLLTGPELSNVPGLFMAWEGGLASALKWPLEVFRQVFGELLREGLVEADWEAGLVWVPKALEHNEPESPNVVESWGPTILELPDCPLRDKALMAFDAYFAGKTDTGKAWAKAWVKACRKGYSPPSRNQEQDTRSRSDLDNSLQRPDRLGREPAALSEAPAGATVEDENPPPSSVVPVVSSEPPSPAPTQPPGVPKTRPRASSCHSAFARSMATRPTEVDDLFEAWRSEAGKPGATLDAQRQALFLRLVDEGVTVEQVRQAVRGAKLDPWAVQTAKLGASAILGSAEQREKYSELAKSPPPAKGPKVPKQPNGGGFGAEWMAASNGGRS